MDPSPQAPADQAPKDSLANRYGRSQRTGHAFWTRWGRWVAVAALVLAVGFVAWLTASATSRTLDWKDVGFEIASPTRASVTFQLTKDPEDTVECAVQVLSEQYAVVGWRTVVIGPQDESGSGLPSDRTRYYDVALRTDGLGVSGGVNSCWIRDS
ncbi:MAG: DUF4307 domain-containing protein [Micrococcus sp.]|nr:DUF4307 domain-containing protein [Micrococcus sp.]